MMIQLRRATRSVCRCGLPVRASRALVCAVKSGVSANRAFCASKKSAAKGAKFPSGTIWKDGSGTVIEMYFDRLNSCENLLRGPMANKVKTEEQPAAQLLRMDNVAIVVQDLDAAIRFFAELGLVLEGRMQVEGDWVDRVVGLTGVRSEVAMMRTPDGHSRLELTKYHAPAAVTVQTNNPPANTLGLHRIMFVVEDIDGVLARLRKHGAELFGEVVQYELMYRLCYLRGPEGIVALAQRIWVKRSLCHSRESVSSMTVSLMTPQCSADPGVRKNGLRDAHR